MKEIINTLNEYKELEKDWDGYEGDAPSNEVVNSVIIFLDKLVEFPTPKTMLSGTGVVGLYWETHKYYIDIIFSKKDIFSYYVDNKESGAYFGDDNIKFENFINSKIINILKELKE